MRLPLDVRRGFDARFLTLALAAGLAGCAGGSASDSPMAASAATPVSAADRVGPGADYPQILGSSFVVDGTEYVPDASLNYDEVGYAGLDAAASGFTASHKTLPLPSYAEVTSLTDGRTILVRVERRGPMTNNRLVALSPDARAELGLAEGAAIRIRRVNPPETERAELRGGKAAPERMATPAPLLAILQRKLPAAGSVSLAQPRAPVSRVTSAELPPSRAARPAVVAQAAPVARRFEEAFGQRKDATIPKAVTTYPLPALPGVSQRSATLSAAQSTVAPRAIATRPTVTPAANAAAKRANFVIQAASFANRENADRAATVLDGRVMRAGRYYRVRTGPFATRGQAEAALAKIRAAGYSDARVQTTG
ncbi:RlpA-like lipoprotein [Alteripontixanthobacter maritimus]|uniref:RlpA-like lipoprotein n=1 Tax=Alteripontixanthobacter maritimus TaxID=2161824 RepID=A0A369QAL6_9SPHN|nr:SPOR domain-containing protein [Alteripontixanthobacter maritimus]RDC59959.1 RlpA-like lipoprotein [Alteripontixanthobacter maritimus]